ncbi:MAG: hypothetical protein J6U96_02970 [Elusimicrobiaceae bacterium]|nr:hypothetical protein [Elusimicrobiaceae bacterium]
MTTLNDSQPSNHTKKKKTSQGVFLFKQNTATTISRTETLRDDDDFWKIVEQKKDRAKKILRPFRPAVIVSTEEVVLFE